MRYKQIPSQLFIRNRQKLARKLNQTRWQLYFRTMNIKETATSFILTVKTPICFT